MRAKQCFSKLLSLLGLLVFLVSCRPEIDLTRPEDALSDYRSKGIIDFGLEFQNFWSGMNHDYLYWDIDKTDWDAVYRTWKPKFNALGKIPESEITSHPNVTTAIGYMKELTKDLADGHLAIYFHQKLNRSIMPADTRARARGDFIPQDEVFFYSNWSSNDADNIATYRWFHNATAQSLNSSSFYAEGHLPNEDPRFKIAEGTIGTPSDFIAYLYFSDFALIEQTKKNASVKAIVDRFFDNLTQAGLKGVIFDLRGNRGGISDNIALLLAPFIDNPLKIAELRSKSGNGRLDYTPWGGFIIAPTPAAKRVKNLKIPVVVLVNEFSTSCGELMPMAIKRLPNGNGCLMGKRTYGATGPRLLDFDDRPLNGGGFVSGILIRRVMQAGWATRAVSRTSYEGVGVPPDIPLVFDSAEWTKFKSGRDTWLEAAKNFINTHQR